MDGPNIYKFSDKNSPSIKLTCNNIRFVPASKARCTYWQNKVDVLSVVILKWRMGGGKHSSSSNIPYIPDFSTILFAFRSFSFFLSNMLQCLNTIIISPPSDISGTPCHPGFHSIQNPRFYLYLISNYITMIGEGNGDVHPLIFRGFTSVT